MANGRIEDPHITEEQRKKELIARHSEGGPSGLAPGDVGLTGSTTPYRGVGDPQHQAQMRRDPFYGQREGEVLTAKPSDSYKKIKDEIAGNQESVIQHQGAIFNRKSELEEELQPQGFMRYEPEGLWDTVSGAILGPFRGESPQVGFGPLKIATPGGTVESRQRKADLERELNGINQSEQASFKDQNELDTRSRIADEIFLPTQFAQTDLRHFNEAFFNYDESGLPTGFKTAEEIASLFVDAEGQPILGEQWYAWIEEVTSDAWSEISGEMEFGPSLADIFLTDKPGIYKSMSAATISETIKALTTGTVREVTESQKFAYNDELIKMQIATGINTDVEAREKRTREYTEAWKKSQLERKRIMEAQWRDPPDLPWHKELLIHAQSPLIAGMEMAESYSSNWSKPFSALALTTYVRIKDTIPEPLRNALNTSLVPIIPDHLLDPIGGSLDQLAEEVQKAKSDTDSWWKAYSMGFDNWEAHGAVKFVTEVALDPFTYAGFGFLTKALKPLPLVGSPLAAFNHGYMRFSDTAVQTLFKAPGKLFPKTLAMKSAFKAYSILDEMNSAIYQIGNKHIANILSPEDIEKFSNRMKFAVSFFGKAKHAGADGPWYRLMENIKMSSAKNRIMPAEIARVAKDILKSEDVTDVGQVNVSILGRVNEIFQNAVSDIGDANLNTQANMLVDVLGTELRHGFYNPKGTKSGLTQILSKQQAKEFLEARTAARRILNDWIGLPNLTGGRVTGLYGDMLRMIRMEDNQAPFRLLKNISEQAEKNIYEFYRVPTQVLGEGSIGIGNLSLYNYRKGVVSTFFANVDQASRALWVDKIEKSLVMPFARAFLVFGAYGPMNIFEGIFKPLFEGHSPFLPKVVRADGGRLPFKIGWIGHKANPIGVYNHFFAAFVDKPLRNLVDSYAAQITKDSENIITDAVIKIDQMPVSLKEETIPLLDRILSMRFGKKFDMYNLMVRSYAKVGMLQRADFMIKDTMRNMQRLDPNLFAETGKMWDDHIASVGKLSDIFDRPEVAKEVEDLLRYALPLGPEQLKEAADMYLISKSAKEFAELLENKNEIDPIIKDIFRHQLDSGNLWKDIPGYMTEGIIAQRHLYFKQPHLMQLKFEEISKKLKAIQPTTYEGALTKFNEVLELSSIRHRVYVSINGHATKWARSLDTKSKSDFYNKIFADMEQFLESSNEATKALLDSVRVNFGDITAARKVWEGQPKLSGSLSRAIGKDNADKIQKLFNDAPIGAIEELDKGLKLDKGSIKGIPWISKRANKAEPDFRAEWFSRLDGGVVDEDLASHYLFNQIIRSDFNQSHAHTLSMLIQGSRRKGVTTEKLFQDVMDKVKDGPPDKGDLNLYRSFVEQIDVALGEAGIEYRIEDLADAFSLYMRTSREDWVKGVDSLREKAAGSQHKLASGAENRVSSDVNKWGRMFAKKGGARLHREVLTPEAVFDVLDDIFPKKASVVPVPAEDKDALKGLIDAIKDDNDATAEAYRVFRKFNKTSFKTKFKDRGNKFWNNYYKEVDNIFGDLNSKLNRSLEGDRGLYQDILAKVPTPVRKVRTSRFSEISIKNVQDILGGGNNLDLGVTDETLHSLLDPDQWVAYIRGRANRVAKAEGKAGADDIGFTRENIKGVYNNIVRSKYPNALESVDDPMAPAINQIKELQQEVEALARNRGYDQVIGENFTDWVDGLVDKLGRNEYLYRTGYSDVPFSVEMRGDRLVKKRVVSKRSQHPEVEFIQPQYEKGFLGTKAQSAEHYTSEGRLIERETLMGEVELAAPLDAEMTPEEMFLSSIVSGTDEVGVDDVPTKEFRDWLDNQDDLKWKYEKDPDAMKNVKPKWQGHEQLDDIQIRQQGGKYPELEKGSPEWVAAGSPEVQRLHAAGRDWVRQDVPTGPEAIPIRDELGEAALANPKYQADLQSSIDDIYVKPGQDPTEAYVTVYRGLDGTMLGGLGADSQSEFINGSLSAWEAAQFAGPTGGLQKFRVPVQDEFGNRNIVALGHGAEEEVIVRNKAIMKLETTNAKELEVRAMLQNRVNDELSPNLRDYRGDYDPEGLTLGNMDRAKGLIKEFEGHGLDVSVPRKMLKNISDEAEAQIKADAAPPSVATEEMYEQGKYDDFSGNMGFMNEANEVAEQKIRGQVGEALLDLIRPGKSGEQFKLPTVRSKKHANNINLSHIEAERNIKNVFADYDNPHAINSFMTSIFPYWNYEAHRWHWIAREFMRHPGMGAAYGKYMNNTDNGYIPLPGPLNTALQINPLRGTIMMGGMTRLMKRDYPEFQDNMPGVSEAVDFMGRFGFYPNVLAMGAIQFLGPGDPRRRQAWSQLLPGNWMSVVYGLQALPGQNILTQMGDTIFPEPFRDYYTMIKAMDIVANNPDKYITVGPDRISVVDIWNKKYRGTPLEPEEEELWSKAFKESAINLMFMTQTGVFRLRPKALIKAQDAYKSLISEWTGYTVAQLDSMSKQGIRYNDHIRGLLSLEQQRQLNHMDAFLIWAGRTQPLLPSLDNAERSRHVEFFSVLDRMDLDAKEVGVYAPNAEPGDDPIVESLASIDDRFILTGDGREFQTRHAAHVQGKSQFKTLLHTLPQYKDIPISKEDRIAYWEDKGVMPLSFSPEEELLHEYYDIELKDVLQFNEATGIWESGKDWDTFFAQRLAIEQILRKEAPDLFKRIQQHMDNNLTPLSQAFRNYQRESKSPYRGLSQLVLNALSEEERVVIKMYHNADTERRVEIRERTDSKGRKIISNYEGLLRDARKRWRIINPDLEAQMLFWGDITTAQTEEAWDKYLEMKRGWGVAQAEA